MTEVPLMFGKTTVPPGEYSLFIDLKLPEWTLIISSWPAQDKFDPNNKAALWGAYGYTPDKDVVARADEARQASLRSRSADLGVRRHEERPAAASR